MTPFDCIIISPALSQKRLRTWWNKLRYDPRVLATGITRWDGKQLTVPIIWR